MSRTDAMSLTMNERSILESIADGVTILDREWRLTYLNCQQAEWFNVSQQEAIGKAIGTVCQAWAVPEIQQSLHRVMTHQTPLQLEYYCAKRQGWFELRMHPSEMGITILAIDITQRKQEEAILRESELRFEAFMNHSPASTWIVNESGHLLYLNPFYLDTFSCDHNVIGKHISEIFPPETAQQFLINNQHVFATAKALQTIEYVSGHDGQVKSFLVCKFPMTHQSGEKLLGGFAIDISEQKRTEAALQEREQHLEIALRTAKLGSWQYDLTTHDLICSEQCKANFGLPADAEFTPETVLSALHPDDRDRVQTAIQQAIDNRIDYEVEERCFYPDGSLHWLIARGGLICDENDHPVRLVGVTLDITERKQFEESLKAANQQVSNILESITDAFVAFDQNWHYTYVNQGAARLLNQSPESLLGRRWQDVFPDLAQQDTIFAQQFQRVMSERVTVHFEGFSAAVNCWLETAIFPANDGIAVFFRDISERVRGEIERKQEEQRKALQYNISQILSQATTLIDVVPALLQTLCEALGWQVGVIWSIDRTSSVLRYTNSWSESTTKTHSFIEASQQKKLELGIGLPGRIWSNHQPAWIADLSQDHNFSRMTAAAQVGLKAGFGFPIVLGDEFFGVIECFSDRTQEPDADLLQLMAAIGRQIGQFMERKRTEEALRESEELFQSFMSHSPVAAYMKEESGRYVYVNSLIERLFNRPACELVGKTDFAWFPVEAIEQIRANDAAVLEQNKVLQFLETVPVGEQIRYFMAFKFPIQQASGRRLLGGVSADITDRIQAEASLKQREEELRVITNTVPVLISFVDADQRYRFNSQRYQDWFEQSPDEIQGKYLWEVLGEIAYATIRPYVEQALSGQAVQFEDQVFFKDGKIRYISANYIPQLDEHDRVIGFVALVSDISDRKQAEQEREQLLEREKIAREQAETANRLKDEFLAVLSHELRSPLNPILGWTKLLRSRQFEPQARDRALEIIERNAKLQTQLIEDLLDVSRILRGKLLLKTQPVDLTTVIEAALETNRLSAEAKGITIHTHLFGSARVAGDAGRLQQIIWNLLSNAVKFTPNGGQVEVTLEPVENTALIQVRDTGKGIASTFLPHVFDYFRQEDSTTTRQFGGLGLGLAIVRYLTELHGGSVEVESAGENLGTTFTVRLPLLNHHSETTNSEDSDNADRPEQLPLAGLHILVVDDKPDMRDLLAVILTEYGAEVEVVSSAQAVLAAIDDTTPDILISDVGMPEMDGYSLMQHIRSKPQGGAILAIALTAYAGEVDQQQALTAGFQKHVAKPVEPEALLQAIMTLLVNDQR